MDVTSTVSLTQEESESRQRLARGASARRSASQTNIPISENKPAVVPKRNSRTIYCFSCNRQEGHFISAYSRFILILAVVLSLGLYVFVGQYRCHCCSSSRFMRYDFLNPKYWYRRFQHRRDGVKRGRHRRSSRRR